ncbi:MAG TPA: uroporphyrinogen decarboxylase family protein [Armatimonadota bacterium]|nr:uroporphyrinogen decarboxylase family protein [Armatimonadota bacterium]
MLRTFEDTCMKPSPDFEQFRKAVMRDGKPDYVPFYELFANVEIMEAILGKKITDRASTIEFYYKAGYDYLPTFPGMCMVLGNLIDRSQGYPIKDWETFEKYVWPESVNYQEFETVGPRLPEGMKMIGQTGGIFETAEKLVGYEQLCYLLVDDPPLVQAVFDHLGELYVKMYTGMSQFEGVGALVISDDLGFKTQTMIDPEYLRKYVLPWHKKLADIIHAAGKPCLLHCCGNLSEIMEDIIEHVGIDAKHSYENSILPVTEAKKLYGDRIALLGGFDMDKLCRGDEQFIRKHTRMLVNELGRDGGYALGSGNSIAPFVPVENYLAMLDEGWRLRGMG